jgi:hypothetical protein
VSAPEAVAGGKLSKHCVWVQEQYQGALDAYLGQKSQLNTKFFTDYMYTHPYSTHTHIH